MVKIKVNVKTKNDSIPSDTTKRKMPVITNPKIRRTPRRDDTNVGDIRVKVKFQKDTVKASPTLENPDVILNHVIMKHQDVLFTSNSAFLTICYTNIAVILVILFLGIQQFFRNIKSGQH